MKERVRSYVPTDARRLTPVLLFCAVTVAFSVSYVLDFPWQLGWLMLSVALGVEMAFTAIDLRRRRYSIDSGLFVLGMITFTVADPVFTIVSGRGFPGVDEYQYLGNEVANLTGFVITVFCAFFFLGRLFIRHQGDVFDRNIVAYKSLPFLNGRVLTLALMVALSPYFLNGGGFSADNLIGSLSARASGYVAFASAGLGAENPVLSLLAQGIPAAVILWFLSLNERSWRWRLLAVTVSALLFAMYVALGGRSGVVMVLVSIGLYFLVLRRDRLRMMRIVLFGLATVVLLSFQINYRDYGRFEEGMFERSPFAGFALNREVAFIVENYGVRVEFTGGESLIERAVRPIPENLVLFITNPVPRKIWHDKPVEPSFASFNNLRTGNTGFGMESNITPTIPGRFYINYGLVGVLQAGLVMGIVWAYANSLIIGSLSGGATRLLVGVVASAILFTCIRDLAPGKFYPLLFLAAYVVIGRLRMRRDG